MMAHGEAHPIPRARLHQLQPFHHVKLRINKPQYLTFVRKIYKLFLTRFLEVPSQGGSSETLS